MKSCSCFLSSQRTAWDKKSVSFDALAPVLEAGYEASLDSNGSERVHFGVLKDQRSRQLVNGTLLKLGYQTHRQKNARPLSIVLCIAPRDRQANAIKNQSPIECFMDFVGIARRVCARMAISARNNEICYWSEPFLPHLLQGFVESPWLYDALEIPRWFTPIGVFSLGYTQEFRLTQHNVTVSTSLHAFN